MTHIPTDAECDASYIEWTGTQYLKLSQLENRYAAIQMAWNESWKQAYAAGAESVAVPREPTQEMQLAGEDAFLNLAFTQKALLVAIWTAMYDAAPTAQDQRAEVASATREDAGTSAVKDAGHYASTSSHPTHTPTPWYADHGTIENGKPTGVTIFQRDDLAWAEKVIAHMHKTENDIDNAEFIVTACNSYREAAARIESDAAKLAAANKRIALDTATIGDLRDRADAAESRLAAATKVIAELMAAGDVVIRQCGMSRDSPEYKAGSARNWQAWQAARAFLERKT